MSISIKYFVFQTVWFDGRHFDDIIARMHCNPGFYNHAVGFTTFSSLYFSFLANEQALSGELDGKLSIAVHGVSMCLSM